MVDILSIHQKWAIFYPNVSSVYIHKWLSFLEEFKMHSKLEFPAGNYTGSNNNRVDPEV